MQMVKTVGVTESRYRYILFNSFKSQNPRICELRSGKKVIKKKTKEEIWLVKIQFVVLASKLIILSNRLVS